MWLGYVYLVADRVTINTTPATSLQLYEYMWSIPLQQTVTYYLVNGIGKTGKTSVR